MTDPAPKRLTLLYQLYLANQSSRAFMRLAMEGTGLSGEEYALYSYLFANGPRTLTQGARDLGMPLTTLATLLAAPIERGEIAREAHPRDRRARLLRLTDAGHERVHATMPSFTAAYRLLLDELASAGVDAENLYAALDQLRAGLDAVAERMRAADDAAATATRT